MPEKIKVRLRVEIPSREVPVRHDIDVELELDFARGKGMSVRGDLPDSCFEQSTRKWFEGQGANVFAAVISWLSAVDKSTSYVPAYRAKKDG